MDPVSTSYLDAPYPESLGSELLSIALIGPDGERRRAVAEALAECHAGGIQEYSSYPVSIDEVPKLLEPQFDVIIIDLDSQPEYALELVESICAKRTAMVMVYSAKVDADLLVRCMRAGAREFFTPPFSQSTFAEALVRAKVQRPANRPAKKKAGRLLVFLGAKGGDGATTLACNFAVSAAQESGESTLLLDLDLPLGDAALNLGVSAAYSTINALQNAARLDLSFLSTLLVKHSSGVSVLAAPGKFPQYDASTEAIDKLITVARQGFDNVVVDIGSRLDLMGTSLFKNGSTVYLVIQANIAGLRNANRLISQYFATEVPKLEIVINRFEARTMGIDEDQISKALTRAAQWKIPNDFAAVRRMQHSAVPLALEDSPISRLIRQMARSACGLPDAPVKATGFSLKQLGRRISAKISASEEAPAIASPRLASTQKQVMPGGTKNAAKSVRTETAKTNEDVLQNFLTPTVKNEAETLTYRGATYLKGVDDQWHIVQTQSRGVEKSAPKLTWLAPAPIACNFPLSATQLNATASVPGAFIYSPPPGRVLSAGTHTLSVTFIPSEEANYTTVQAAVPLVVAKTLPIITWPTPAPIACGSALDATQLNATASVPGRFAYMPTAGEVLTEGVRTLSVVFTPEDTASYRTAVAAVSLKVTQAVPINAGSRQYAVDDHSAPRNAPVYAEPQPPAADQAKPLLQEPTVRALAEALAPHTAIELESKLNLMGSAVFKDGTTIYLVMQPGSAGVGDSKRLIAQFFTNGEPKPEIVINQLEARYPSVLEDETSTTLTKPVLSPISRLIGQVGRFTTYLPAASDHATGFSLKSLGRRIWAKLFTAEEGQATVQMGLAAEQDEVGRVESVVTAKEQKAQSEPLQVKLASVRSRKPASPANPSSKKVKAKAAAKQPVKPKATQVEKTAQQGRVTSAAKDATAEQASSNMAPIRPPNQIRTKAARTTKPTAKKPLTKQAKKS